MSRDPEEWLRQADYDLETAGFMVKGGRYFYAVFMCHLALEKALKGLYHKKLNELPPRTHSLIYLLNKIGVKSSEEFGKFLVKIDQASVVTRYPEDLAKLQQDYTFLIVEDILTQTEEVILWIKKVF